MNKSTGDAGKAMKRTADDDAAAARTRSRVVSSPAKNPVLSAMFGATLNRVSALEKHVLVLEKKIERLEKLEEEKNMSDESYAADSCDTVEKDPCSACAAKKEELKDMYASLQRKNMVIKKLKDRVKALKDMVTK